MSSNLLSLVIIAAVGGLAVTLQAQLMGLMDMAMGTRESVFITYAGGGLVISLLMLLVWRGGNLAAWHTVPPYAFLSGLTGLIIVGSIGYTAPRLGLIGAFAVILAAQYSSGALIDHFGLLGATPRPLDLSRLVGMGVLMLGAWLVVR